MIDAGSLLIYSAQSKRNFYCRDAVCEYILRAGSVPVNPFRVFDYFLNERVSPDVIRAANRVLLARCDEVWVFGDIADGVFGEIEQAIALGRTLRLFTIDWQAEAIRPLGTRDAEFEQDLIEATGGVDRLVQTLIRGGVAEAV